MKHKEFNQENKIDDKDKKKTDLYIVKRKKPYIVDDFLPKYSYDYEHTDIDGESLAMIDDLHGFIKNNSNLAIKDYSCSDTEAIIEGFQRAIALVELYIKTMYIEE